MALLNPLTLGTRRATVATSLPGVPDWPTTLERTARGLLFASATLLPLIFWRGLHEPFEFAKYLLLNFVALALLGLKLAANALRTPTPRFVVPRDCLSLGVLGLLLSAMVSTVFSISPATSLEWGRHSCLGLFAYLSGAIIFFSTRNLIRTEGQQRICVAALVLGGVGAAFYGLVQIVGLDPFEWGKVSHFAGQQRACGTLGHPNHLAALLVVLLPFVLDRGRFPRTRSFVIAILFAVVILFTYSRIAWVATAVVVLLQLGTIRQRFSKRSLLAGLLGLVALATVLLISSASLRERVGGIFRFGDRAEIWVAALKIGGDYPITGCGLNAFASAFGPHRTAAHEAAEWDTAPTNAHNELLHLFATQGAVGSAMGLLLIVGIVLTLRRVPDSSVIGRSLLALAIVLSTGFLVVPLLAVLCIVLGLLASRVPVSEPSRGGNRVFALALAVGFAVLGLIAAGSLFADLTASRQCSQALGLPSEERSRAKELLASACELRPRSSVYWTIQATFLSAELHQLQDPKRAGVWLQEAREAMRQVTLLKPKDGPSHTAYARLLSQSQPGTKPEPALAEAAYLEALRWEPNDPRLQIEVASRCLEKKEFDTARKHIEQARRISPRFAMATTLEALILWHTGDRLAAIKLAERAFFEEWHTDIEAYRDWYGRYGLMTFNLELFEHTVAVGEQMVANWPRWPMGYLLIASGCEKLDRFEKAKANYRDVLWWEPTNLFAQSGLERMEKRLSGR